MNYTGRRRRITSAQLKVLRAWKPLKEVAKDLGINPKIAAWARHYYFRQPSP